MTSYIPFLFVIMCISAAFAQTNDENNPTGFTPEFLQNSFSIQVVQQDCNDSNCPISSVLDVKSNEEDKGHTIVEPSTFLRIVNFPESREEQTVLPYPTFASVPLTNFVCPLQYGYYADGEAACQVFHVCHGGRKFSFLCPNETVFNQQYFVCDHWANVDCQLSRNFYQLNSQIGLIPQSLPHFNEDNDLPAFRSASNQKVLAEAIVIPHRKPAFLPGFIEPKPVDLAAAIELPTETSSLEKRLAQESTISGNFEAKQGGLESQDAGTTVENEIQPETESIPGSLLVAKSVPFVRPTSTEKEGEIERTTLSDVTELPSPN